MEQKTSSQKSALQLEADEVLGLNFELFSINYKTYAVYPPSIITLSRMARYVAPLDVTDMNNYEVLQALVSNNRNAVKYLALAVVGDAYDTPLGRLRYWRLCRRFKRAKGKELVLALQRIQAINSLNDFFLSAHLMSAVVKTLKPSEEEPSQD